MPINRPKLLIRADAGPTIGTGHVTRSLSIAREWKNSGGTVTFACGMLPRGLLKKIASEHFHFIPIRVRVGNDTKEARLKVENYGKQLEMTYMNSFSDYIHMYIRHDFLALKFLPSVKSQKLIYTSFITRSVLGQKLVHITSRFPLFVGALLTSPSVTGHIEGPCKKRGRRERDRERK